MSRHLLIPALTLTAVLAACNTNQPAPAPPAPEQPAAPAPAPANEPAPIDKAELQAEAQTVTLVPSPTEMQNALKDAGIAQGLSELVPNRAAKMDIADKDVVAVRTGAVLAWTLLTVKDAPKDKLISRMDEVKAGMTSLGAGTDINRTIDDLEGRLNSDALSRDDLLSELDEMHGAIIPEIQFEAGDRCVPLIQAGSWLAGVNLVSTAIVKANNPTAGTKLLRQPEVADHFLTYMRTEGADKAPPEVMQKLESALTKLKEVAEKPELTIDDVKQVQAETDSVLALL